MESGRSSFWLLLYLLLKITMMHHIVLIEYIIYNIWYFLAGLVMKSQNM